MKCPHCGQTTAKKRSYEQHKRFFGVVDAAFYHWPESHKFQPTNSEHLRAWLLCAANHVEIIERDKRISDAGAAEIRTVMESLRKDYVWIRQGEDSYFVIGAKSIAYDKLSHKDACKVFSDVDEIVCTILQIKSTDQLLDEHERAA